jgi:hypothetical protein
MKYFIFFVLSLTIQSCTIYGLTNDYSKLDAEHQQLISKYSPTKELKTKYIYEISATQLKTELKKYEKSLVYIFANSCTSKYCLPLSVYEDYAQENGYQLFLMMNGYANLSESLSQNFSSSLFAVDAQAYNTKWKNKYLKGFQNELKNLPIDTKQTGYQGSIYFFEGDNLIKIQKEL